MNVRLFSLCGLNEQEENSHRPCLSTNQSPSFQILIVDIVAIVFVIDNNINKMTTIIYFLQSGLSVYLYLK
jgi:hypothetical protein